MTVIQFVRSFSWKIYPKCVADPYYIENENGSHNPLQIREYLISNPNEFEDDNLGNLPNGL